MPTERQNFSFKKCTLSATIVAKKKGTEKQANLPLKTKTPSHFGMFLASFRTRTWKLGRGLCAFYRWKNEEQWTPGPSGQILLFSALDPQGQRERSVRRVELHIKTQNILSMICLSLVSSFYITVSSFTLASKFLSQHGVTMLILCFFIW